MSISLLKRCAPSSRPLTIACASAFLMLFAAACATAPDKAKPPSNGGFQEQDARRALERARKSLDAGEHNRVIPRFLDVIVRYGETEAADDAHYFLGIAYYRSRGINSAIEMFREYLRRAPEGEYARDCRKYLVQLTKEYVGQHPTPESLDKGIADLENRLETKPDDAATQWELADLLWKRERYEEAGGLYAALAANHPEYAGQTTFRSRVELQPGGAYILLTPAEILRRHIEAQPIAIINEATFKSGRHRSTLVSKYYAVTGQALNRSNETLHDVQVIVTIYGFGNVVFDTGTARIGRLKPGETRAFSLRFSNFDNIYNVHRHECVPTFQR